MQPQPAGYPPVLPSPYFDPATMSQDQIAAFIRDLARRDPVKAMEMWTQHQAKSRLDDLGVLLGVTIGILVFVLLELFVIAMRI